MKVIETDIAGVLIFEPRVFRDERGEFLETWSMQRYKEAGIVGDFVQDNVSYSVKGVLRGLHYQYPHSQGKLVQVLEGEVLDVAVDIRQGSPTFGKYVSAVLSRENHRQLYIPPGFAHGFCVISDSAIFSYKCTDYYNAKTEGGILWNDPDIGIKWPLTEPILSEKDRKYLRLKDAAAKRLPVYEEGK